MEWNDWHARVWRGRGNAAAVARAVIPTGFRELDRSLPGGGWPLGAITEIFVDGYGIGELGLLMPALAALTKADPAKPKKWVAWIAPPFVPYAPALQQHGVNIDRLLMIHPTSGYEEPAVGNRASRALGVERGCVGLGRRSCRRRHFAALAAGGRRSRVLGVAVSAGECASPALTGRVANPFCRSSAVANACGDPRGDHQMPRRAAGRRRCGRLCARCRSSSLGFAPVSGHGARSRNLSTCSPRTRRKLRAADSRPVPSKLQLWIAVCLPSLAFECLPAADSALPAVVVEAERGQAARRRREPRGSRGGHRLGNEAPDGHGAGSFFAGVRAGAASRAAKPRVFGRVGADADFDGQRRGA